MTISCPLCCCEKLGDYFQNKHANYLSCSQCDLIFATPTAYLSDIDEKARYDLHQNNFEDVGYRKFLSQVLNPVMDLIKIGDKGLDFGCGPSPVLSAMFAQFGYEIDLFDKFYANNPSIFNNKYDFITATEVLEHLHQPQFELDRLYGMLNQNGVLAVMTKMFDKSIDFASWYYKDDPTHIAFFGKNSMMYLADRWAAKVKFYQNVTLFFK